MGLRNGNLVDREFIKDQFDSPAEYRKMLLDYLESKDLPEEIEAYLQTLED